MPALKTSAARILAALAASASFAPAVCAAAQVKVNDEAPLDLQSPPGFTYTTGGSTAVREGAALMSAFKAAFAALKNPPVNRARGRGDDEDALFI